MTIKKIFQFTSLIVVSFFIIGCSNSENRTITNPTTLTLEWNIDTNQSESALYDSVSNAIYVSNHGENGYISKLNSDGSIDTKLWFSDLRYPKGMAIRSGSLYVTDDNTTVKINISNGNLEAKLNTPSGVDGLNDIVYDSNNDLFYISNVSWPEQNDTIYQMTPDGNYSLFYDMDGNGTTHNQNGVNIDNGKLIMQGEIGYLKSVDLTSKEVAIISSSIDNVVIDGIAKYKGIGYFVSGSISGGIQNKLYFISTDGTATELDKGDTTSFHDISYTDDLELLIVPSLGDNYVRGYKVK
jgi:hypothetical protein